MFGCGEGDRRRRTVVNAIGERFGFDLRNTSPNEALDADDVHLLMIIAENNMMKVN